tara:strand:+ start:832 stop:1647 length:816 start_codon:yes stop_codon:yes gene_type:complete
MATLRNLLKLQEPRNELQYIIYPETREELKPLVFFDAGKFTRNDNGFKIGMHPHSGIGIITYFHGTDLHHKDSKDNDGIIHDGGAQWIRTAGGLYHEEAYRRKHDDSTKNDWTGSIHQLWIQLPPEYEESEADYSNLIQKDIPQVDNVKIIVGSYKGVSAKMVPPVNMTYLDISLKENEEWEFQIPKNQTTGFIFTRDGQLSINGLPLANTNMAILEHNDGLIKVKGTAVLTNFILVLAEPSPYQVITKGGQIHTNQEALVRSTRRIYELG